MPPHLLQGIRPVRSAEHAAVTMIERPAQEAMVRKEAAKKRKHMQLRALLQQAPDVLTSLFPCFMASPLSVSRLIGLERRYFDMVVFDEASQVLPEDAVCSLLRARQVIVAGDRRQLPPTTFFADGADEEELDETAAAVGGGVEGFESILDQLGAFLPNWLLEWHYRSFDESLIAFSNHHVYNDRLITFPGPVVPQ